jgi:hypothetical protein
MICRTPQDIALAAEIDGAADTPMTPEAAMKVALILAPYMTPAAEAAA